MKTLREEIIESNHKYERDSFYSEDSERRMTEAQRKQRERRQWEYEPERAMD